MSKKKWRGKGRAWHWPLPTEQSDFCTTGRVERRQKISQKRQAELRVKRLPDTSSYAKKPGGWLRDLSSQRKSANGASRDKSQDIPDDREISWADHRRLRPPVQQVWSETQEKL